MRESPISEFEKWEKDDVLGQNSWGTEEKTALKKPCPNWPICILYKKKINSVIKIILKNK